MKAEYRLIKNYKEDKDLRKSLSDLAKKTFGVDIEAWYQSGYWLNQYIPYSIVAEGKVVANISVNPMEFIEKENTRHLIQLGTVITDKMYRGQGLSRYLMEAVLEDYKTNTDGIYLFANDSVLDFYPKFGFEKSKEYQYTKKVKNTGTQSAVLKPMKQKEDWESLEKVMKAQCYVGSFEMNNPGLLMFYATSVFKNKVYYIEEKNTYVFADINGTTLILYSIIADGYVSEDWVIEAFGDRITNVIFGYTPRDVRDCQKRELKEEDTTLFVMGQGLANFDKEDKMFPVISHA